MKSLNGWTQADDFLLCLHQKKNKTQHLKPPLHTTGNSSWCGAVCKCCDHSEHFNLWHRSEPWPPFSVVTQGEGVRPEERLLCGVSVRSPPGRDVGAGGRLEDCERRRRGVGVCVGDEDDGQTVGNAQQVRRGTCQQWTVWTICMDSCLRQPLNLVDFIFYIFTFPLLKSDLIVLYFS